MRIMYDATCPRCGSTESFEGMDLETAAAAADTHVCCDGVKPSIVAQLVERRVPGPGERTKLPEERS